MTEELGGSELSTGGSPGFSSSHDSSGVPPTHRVPTARLSHPNLEILWFASLQEKHMLPHLKI